MSVSLTKEYVGAPTAPFPEKNNVVAVTVVVADNVPVTASPVVAISNTFAPAKAQPMLFGPIR